MSSIRIARGTTNFEREPLVRPFGFKGGYMREIWQVPVALEATTGERVVAVSTQNVLWSDPGVFASHDEPGANALMYAMTEHAVRLAAGRDFETPIDLLEQLLPQVWNYGKAIAGRDDLRLTFALNALVGLDAAAWKLYAKLHGCRTFDDMLPPRFRSVLAARHHDVACIPLMAYGIPLEDVSAYVRNGYFFLKVKIGCDPNHDGDREKMLQWDMRRIEDIHRAVGGQTTPHTESGRIPYYFDANGRYDTRERLERLLEHCRRIGAFDQIAIVEEPFPEESRIDVSGLGVRIAADESAHSDGDVTERIALGYGAVALKPIAKTLSMTLKMAEVAAQANLPMFCADLTVGPSQVDWNKNVACRLPALPGLKVAVLETNGSQNYRRWDTLRSFFPTGFAPWTDVHDGCFQLSDDFYQTAGGIFLDSEHYSDLTR